MLGENLLAIKLYSNANEMDGYLSSLDHGNSGGKGISCRLVVFPFHDLNTKQRFIRENNPSMMMIRPKRMSPAIIYSYLRITGISLPLHFTIILIDLRYDKKT